MSHWRPSIGRMQLHFDPWGTAHACWHCTRFVAMIYAGTAAQCSLPRAPCVRSQPERGCSGFVREVGSDDEPGPPAARPAGPAHLNPGPRAAA